MGPIDLGGGPVLLQVPATGGAYYAMQFVGRLDEQLRLHWPARDRHRGQQLPADSTSRSGQVPDGAVQLRFNTRIATITGRWACSGVDDLDRIRRLQQATTLTPVDRDAPAPIGLSDPAPGVAPELISGRSYGSEWPPFRPAARDLPLQQESRPARTT
jgi:hypothetical protein